MKLTIDHQPQHAVVAPEGDVDLNVSPEFQQALRSALAKKPQRLIVDLAAVPYMDSSGVATLVDALQQSRKAGANLIICGVQPKVRSILEITRLDAVFTITKSVEEATTA
ncbi:MAG: STAS domain-containing protein [Phycisphaerales bacterium]